MCEVPVFYATTEGQTRRIAERIATRLQEHGFDSRPVAIISEQASHIDWPRVRGVVVGASLHLQRHQPEAVAFARAHAKSMSAIPSLFFSVSLSAASARSAEVQAAQQLAEKFGADTGWMPSRAASVAGRLAYTRYNWFVRLLMRHIAAREGASSDTSRDHEFTDWAQVTELADGLAREIRTREEAAAARQPLLSVAS